ncbi:hypothetical protein BC629DRAFT_1540225 [Irpex lacteus]|nr:hypothetical protein BC629DRAFT_1540225 [Irpex lacteus]
MKKQQPSIILVSPVWDCWVNRLTSRSSQMSKPTTGEGAFQSIFIPSVPTLYLS